MRDIIQKYEEPMIDFCQRIIQVPSLSGDEGEVAKLYAAEMETLGYDEVFTDKWGNVTGLIRGTEDGPTLMFNGHMDVVSPGCLNSWNNINPYGGLRESSTMWDMLLSKEEEVEVIHGRGSSDMKGGCAAQIYAGGVIAEMKSKGYPIKGNFLLAAVVMEENGEAMGTIKLIEETLPARGISIDGMICAEPSSMKLAIGHRGRMEIKVTVYGESCHGSSPWLGVNAAEQAAKFILRAKEKMEEHPKKDHKLGKAGMALTMMDVQPNELCIVPDRCTLVYDRRLVPSETIDSVLQEMKDIAAELSQEDKDFRAEIEINRNSRKSYTGLEEEIESKKAPWIIAENHPFVQASALGLERSGIKPEFIYWPFSTDIPPVGTGLNKPAIGFSAGQEICIHTPWERIRVNELKQSLLANVLMYEEISKLPKESFVATSI
jgi:putative selenium metabolism hydrolase